MYCIVDSIAVCLDSIVKFTISRYIFAVKKLLVTKWSEQILILLTFLIFRPTI